jgi:hypothetical protein
MDKSKHPRRAVVVGAAAAAGAVGGESGECEEQKPVCHQCTTAGIARIYPNTRLLSNIRFKMSHGPPVLGLHAAYGGPVDFINLTRDDVPKICAQYQLELAEEISSPPLPCPPSGLQISTGQCLQGTEAQLIQFCK